MTDNREGGTVRERAHQHMMNSVTIVSSVNQKKGSFKFL